MAEETPERPFLKKDTGLLTWDWWGENPGEIVLVVFIIVVFFFIYSLPPQGWGIDSNPDVSSPGADAPAPTTRPDGR